MFDSLTCPSCIPRARSRGYTQALAHLLLPDRDNLAKFPRRGTYNVARIVHTVFGMRNQRVSLANFPSNPNTLFDVAQSCR